MSISRWMDKKAVVHIHNGVLLSRQKEYIWISSDEMDETGADHKSSFKHSSRVIFLVYGLDNNIVLKIFQFPCVMFSSCKYEFLTKAYYNLTSLLLSSFFLSTVSSLYVLATVAFFQFLNFVCSVPTSMPWRLAFCLKKTLCCRSQVKLYKDLSQTMVNCLTTVIILYILSLIII